MKIQLISNSNNDKKGIYKDLYKALDADKKIKAQNIKNKPRGIYKQLYSQLRAEELSFKSEEKKKKRLNLLKNIFNSLASKTSYIFSSVKGEFKILLFACAFARAPICNSTEKNDK